MNSNIKEILNEYLKDNKEKLQENNILPLFFNVNNIISENLIPYFMELGIDILEYLEGIPYKSGVNLNIKDLIIPKNIRFIDNRAFIDNSYIKTIRFEKDSGLKSINNWALYNMTNLEAVYLPASLITIGLGNFLICPNLKDIYYDGTKDEWEKIDKHEIPEGITIRCKDGDIKG